MTDQRGPSGPLSEQNRARFRGFAAPDIWQQMSMYGLGQGNTFPGTGDIPHLPKESEFLVMMLKAFKEQEDKKRKNGKPEFSVPGKEFDPILGEARVLSGR